MSAVASNSPNGDLTSNDIYIKRGIEQKLDPLNGHNLVIERFHNKMHHRLKFKIKEFYFSKIVFNYFYTIFRFTIVPLSILSSSSN